MDALGCEDFGWQQNKRARELALFMIRWMMLTDEALADYR